MPRSLALVLCGIAPALSAASAQSVTAADALRVLPTATPIRIRTTGQSIIEGRLAELTDSTVSVRDQDAIRQASLSRIESISLRAPNTKRGAIVTALLGAGTVGVLVGVLASGLCEGDCNGAFGDGFALGAAAGAAAGAVTGAVVGSFSSRWREYWSRDGSIRATLVDAGAATQMAREGKWSTELHAAIGTPVTATQFKTPMMVSGAFVRARSGRMDVGLEVGYATAGNERHTYSVLQPSGPPVNEYVTFGRSAYHASLLARARSIGGTSDAMYWLATAGVAVSPHSEDVSYDPGSPQLRSPGRYSYRDWYPTFSIGVGRRVGRVLVQARYFAPMLLVGGISSVAILSVGIPLR